MWPEEIAPTCVTQTEIIHNEWTTNTKVNDWFTYNKQTLVELGLAIDKPMALENGQEAELTIGEEEKRRIINWDETDHPLATQHDKGGSRSLCWGDPSLPKGSNSGCHASRHTTGIYGANAAGEALPPIY